MNIAEIADKVRRLEARRDQANAAVEREKIALEEVQADVVALEESRDVVQAVAEELQRRAHDRIARAVSRCLQSVFDDPYEFEIRFERKRGKTEALLVLKRDDVEHCDPANEVGGGVLDVAALALRLSCAMVGRPPSRRLFVLDEPWSNVRGERNRERTRRLLNMLSDEFGVQWIVNTDVPAYRLGKVVDMEEDRDEKEADEVRRSEE